MVRRAAICQKLEPMPRLILRILNRAGIAPWFRDFEAVVIRNEPILGLKETKAGYCNKRQKASMLRTPSHPASSWKGLLHDASEAYLADLPKPVKMGLPDCNLLETQVETVIAEKFDLALPTPPEIKSADLAMLKHEIFSFFGPARYFEDFQEERPTGKTERFLGFEPKVAESKFLELYSSLAMAPSLRDGEPPIVTR
jgi:hypothetical protein